MTTQQMWSGNRVEVLPPSPGDMFVVTLLFGKRVKIQPASEYQQAKTDAHSFASSNRMGVGAYTMKVLSLTLEETLTLCGISRAELFADRTPGGYRGAEAAGGHCLHGRADTGGAGTPR